MSFFDALVNPSFSFLRNALIAGVLSSVLFGTLGAVVTVKRIASLAGAISHAVLGGIGLSLFLTATMSLSWLTPMLGAIIFALLAALLIGFVSLKAKQREDTVINAIWAIGMSTGVLFMAKTPGYTDPSSYLFGNILLLSQNDLYLLAVLDILVLLLAWRFYPQIVASSFDEDFARSRGVNTTVFFLALLIVTAIAVVLLQTFVGIVMVIAMLTLPAGTASYFSKSLASMMIFGSLFALLVTSGGITASWFFDVPAGALVVIIAGAIFLIATLTRMAIQKIRKKKVR